MVLNYRSVPCERDSIVIIIIIIIVYLKVDVASNVDNDFARSLGSQVNKKHISTYALG